MKRTAYLGFAVFGAFWGVWGASVPAIRDQAGLTDGQLGTALLFVGAGALPAMLTAGKAVDRWGRVVAAVLVALLGAVGLVVALAARDLLSLCVGLAAVGAASGAADVAINAAAGAAERAAGRPVITRSHGVFSASVVVGSLSTGLLGLLGAPAMLPFALVAAAALATAIFLTTVTGKDARGAESIGPEARGDDADLTGGRTAAVGLRAYLPVLGVAGGLGALAFAVENAHQSWSAAYLTDLLHAGPAVAAAGPAVFAAVVAVTRFTAGAMTVQRPTTTLVAGALIAALGTGILAVAGEVAVALAGLALAAAGTAVLFPTLLGQGVANVPEAQRGQATSIVSTVAYLGFLAGPVYVGLWAEAAGLSAAMAAVAALAVLLALLSPALLAPALRRGQGVPRGERVQQPGGQR